MKLLGYANPSRIRMTCAVKPGGAHLGQVAIYAGESVDPMDLQEQEAPTFMGEPVVANRAKDEWCPCCGEREETVPAGDSDALRCLKCECLWYPAYRTASPATGGMGKK